MDESNATCGKRLQSIGLENTEDSRRAYRELLVTTPGLGKYISGAIMFEETLFQKVGPTCVRGLGPGLARRLGGTHALPALTSTHLADSVSELANSLAALTHPRPISPPNPTRRPAPASA
jgi:hypothetical protein